MRTFVLPTLCAVLSLSVAAQTASFSTLGTSCVGNATSRVVGSPTIRLAGTLPLVGSTYTVTVSGPANAAGVLMYSTSADRIGLDLTAAGMTGCRQYLVGPFASVPIVLANGVARMTMPASGLGSALYFQARVTVPGANPAGVLTSHLGIARIGTEPDLTPAEIGQFAPVVRIHPAEEYRPMSPDDFIARSRFRHHRGWQSDQGFHRTALEWVSTNSHDSVYYAMPAYVLNAYTLHADGKNRRPRDGNCGDSYNVFLQSAGRLTGPGAPTGVVPAYYHYRRFGDRHEVQYWWFCGFNDSFASFNHQGDWEHVTVHVVRRQIVGVFFASHEGGEFVRVGAGLRFVGSRPLVYLAKGSHAAYHTTGTWMAGIDVTSDLGPEWDISRTLRPLATQPWKDFAGAWGEVGTIATRRDRSAPGTSATTGRPAIPHLPLAADSLPVRSIAVALSTAGRCASSKVAVVPPRTSMRCIRSPSLPYSATKRTSSPVARTVTATPPLAVGSTVISGAAGGSASSHGLAGTSARLAYGPARNACAMPPRSASSAFMEKWMLPEAPGSARVHAICASSSSLGQPGVPTLLV